jgi:rubrerythrin
MELDLTSLEVVEMAQWIESRSARYYRLLARRTRHIGTQQMFLSLSAMEEEHEKIFATFKNVLDPGEELIDVDSSFYTRVIARMTLDVDAVLAEVMTGREMPDEAANKAVDFEKSTIVFLVGLKNMLSATNDRQKVDRIIQEEVGHILSLSGYLYPGGSAQFADADGRYAEEGRLFPA